LNTGNDLLAQVKENQPALMERLREIAGQEPVLDTARSHDKGRNRQEDRIVQTFDLAGAFAETDWAPHLATGIRVTRSTWLRSASTGLWTKREETAWYVSSASFSAKVFADAIRGHWGIENCSHHVRDVTMAEDRSRIRVNPGVFARLRSCALNILRANGVQNVADACWLNALSLKRILDYPALS
jgi:hypothetical protein